MNWPELLAPAGSFEHALAALRFGADAVYAGVGSYNLRAQAPNFSPRDVTGLVDSVHAGGGKVYAVLNAYADDSMIDRIRETLEVLSRGVLPDAFIVSDPGVLECCRAICPDVAVHLSTQSGVFSLASMRFWKDRGVERIILPREVDLGQIERFSRSGICDTEIFVHGAMCVAVAGRCLLGQYRNGRNANQGDCPQPCRLRYRISDIEPNGASWDVEEDEQGVYLMNARDLNTLDILPQIVAAGVSSLKVEGRNKSVHYVSSVINVYRQALDSCLADPARYRVHDDWCSELERLDHRPYTTGFYGTDSNLQAQAQAREPSRIRVLAMVKERLSDGRVVVDVRNPFTPGETVSRLSSGTIADDTFVVPDSLCDLSGNKIDNAVTNRLVVFPGGTGLRPGDLLRRILE